MFPCRIPSLQLSGNPCVFQSPKKNQLRNLETRKKHSNSPVKIKLHKKCGGFTGLKEFGKNFNFIKLKARVENTDTQSERSRLTGTGCPEGRDQNLISFVYSCCYVMSVFISACSQPFMLTVTHSWK